MALVKNKLFRDGLISMNLVIYLKPITVGGSVSDSYILSVVLWHDVVVEMLLVFVMHSRHGNTSLTMC